MRLGPFRFQTEHNNQALNKIILIGMLEDGPTGRGFTFHDHVNLYKHLGENQVTRAYRFLMDNGMSEDDVLFYRLNGLPSQLTIEGHSETPLLHLRTLTSNDKENNIIVRTNEDGLTLYSTYAEEDIESGRRADFSRTYRFDDYAHPYDNNTDETYISFNELADAITNDAFIGIHNVIAQDAVSSVARNDLRGDESILPLTELAFQHGDSEESLCILNEDDLSQQDISDYWVRFREYVTGTGFSGESLSPLIGHQAELLYFADFPIDKDKRIGELAARVAEQKTADQHILCNALFHTSTVPGMQELEEDEYFVEGGLYYNTLEDQEIPWEPLRQQEAYIETLNNLFAERIVESSYLSHLHTVVGEESRDDYLLPSAVHYAHLYLMQGIGETLTNKELIDFKAINTELPKEVIAKLSRNGYICTVPSIRRHMVFTRAKHRMTPGAGSPSFQVKRLLSYIEFDLTSILDPYIGNTQTYFNASEVEDRIVGYLRSYEEEAFFSQYSVRIERPGAPHQEAKISIQLQLYDELVSIQNTLTLEEEGRSIDRWTLTRSLP